MEYAPLREVLNLVAFSTRPRFVLDGDPFKRTRRLTASAGALHPIETVLFERRGSGRVMRYDPSNHRLELLATKDAGALKRLAENCTDIAPDARGTALILIGDLGRVSGVYENPTSLLWRDAGALLQTLALCARAYRLAFCPLGALGTEILKAVDLGQHNSVAVGIAMIGRPVDES
jgi:SagB-type dehydrogenase family enzyme